MNPFLDIKVLPTYGDFSALITWRLSAGFERSTFSVYRSPDGINDWQLIGKEKGITSFRDPGLAPDGKLNETYYRVTLEKGELKAASDTVATFGTVPRREFAAARKIMELEVRQLRHHHAVKVCKLRVTGNPCPICVDPDTGQVSGSSMCDTCYHTGYEGGFWAPVDTFMRIEQRSQSVQVDSAEGAGSTDPTYDKARMLAFPFLEKNDLIVYPPADRRWLVESCEIAYFNGKIPLIATLSLVLLRRTDVRYSFPIT